MARPVILSRATSWPTHAAVRLRANLLQALEEPISSVNLALPNQESRIWNNLHDQAALMAGA